MIWVQDVTRLENLTFTFKQERLNVTKLGHSTRTILIIIYKICVVVENLQVPVFLTRLFLIPYPLGKIYFGVIFYFGGGAKM